MFLLASTLLRMTSFVIFLPVHSSIIQFTRKSTADLISKVVIELVKEICIDFYYTDLLELVQLT